MYSLSQAASTIHLSQVRWGGAASEFSFSLASLICYPGGSLSGHWLFVVAARRNRSQQDKHAIAGGAAGKVATRQVLRGLCQLPSPHVTVCQRPAMTPISAKGLVVEAALDWRFRIFPKGIGCVVVAAAVAIEHQRHKTAAN
jgi:hypothetical protein